MLGSKSSGDNKNNIALDTANGNIMLDNQMKTLFEKKNKRAHILEEYKYERTRDINDLDSELGHSSEKKNKQCERIVVLN